MLNPDQKGAALEYLAVAKFIEAGFQVFINAVPSGPADIVVWDQKNTYFIDIKKINRYVRKDGTINYMSGKRNHDHIIYLGHCSHDGWIWLSEPPEALLNVF